MIKSIKRSEINGEVPADATHCLFNPSDKFVQMFYKIEGESVKYRTFAKLWFYSDSNEKDPNFKNKLTVLTD